MILNTETPMTEISTTLPARQNAARYQRARDTGHGDFIAEAIKFDAYYRGEQWDAKDKAKLDAQGRPAMTVNLVAPTVNAILGEYSNRRADFQYKPRRGEASDAVAQTLTKLVMQICDNNDYDQLETEIFGDGLITGRGYLDVRIDFEDNTLGEVRIETLDPRSVIPDPSANSYDPKDWNEVMTTRWASLDDLAATYGQEKADAVRVAAQSATTATLDMYGWDDTSSFGDMHKAAGVGAYDDVDTERALRSVRIIERQFYTLSKVREFVSLRYGDVRPVPESWEEERVQAFARDFGLGIRTRLTRRVRWVVSAGDSVVLHESWSPYTSLTVVPFFCYFRRGKPFGVVKNLISPQDILNKSSSQVLHVVNTTANSGWKVEAGSLVNMTSDDLAARGAETGLVLEYAAGRNAPEKIQPNNVPPGLTDISMRAAQWMREIPGVNSAMLGLEGAEVSGVALENKQLRASLQLQTVMDNLVRTRKIVARKILELVQAFYTEERILYISDRFDAQAPQEALVINQQAAGEIANNITLGEYDVVVSSMPARDTFEESQFAQVIQLREAGAPIPGHWLVKYSSLFRKAELAEEVKNLEGIGQPDPVAEQMTQMQLQMMAMELEELAAKTDTHRATAELTRAKARDVATQGERDLAKHQADTDLAFEELGLRDRLQRLKELSKQLQTMQQSRIQQQKIAQQARTNLARERDLNTPRSKSTHG